MTIALHTSKELSTFTEDQVGLIKNYLCKGITDDELKLFSAVCKKTGLDPFMKQIYAVRRKDQMTIQTSIDGYRLIAERTGRYAPGKETSYQYNTDGKLVSATSYIKKQTADGTWHEIGATAFYDEYKPNYSNQFWDTKPHIMLAKCAEALSLRKAFPNELSGLYSEDEMHQASNSRESAKKEAIDPITETQFEELNAILKECSRNYQTLFLDSLTKLNPPIHSLDKLPCNIYQRVKDALTKKYQEHQAYLQSIVDDEVANDA